MNVVFNAAINCLRREQNLSLSIHVHRLTSIHTFREMSNFQQAASFSAKFLASEEDQLLKELCKSCTYK